MPCPDPQSLDDETLLKHLEACPSCRERLEQADRIVASLPVEPPASRPRILPWAAAAAAILIAVAAWRPKTATTPSAPPPAADSRYRFLPPGITVRLSRDAWMQGLDLLSGSALVSTDTGPVTVGIPAGRIRLESGSVLIEPEPAKTALLLRDAWAADPAWRVTVLDGEAVLASLHLKAGGRARWAPGSAPESLPPAPQEASCILQAIPESGWRTGPLPGKGYVLEARLTPESMPPEGDAGIAYRVGDRHDVWWLRGGLTRSALGRDPLSGEVRVRIVVDQEISIFVNGKDCGRLPLSAPREAGPGGPEPVRSVRGKVRVDSLRWRPLG